MDGEKLSSETISLIHHVKLSESDWWDNTVKRLIQGILWTHRKPLLKEEIHRKLKEEFGYDVSGEKLDRLLNDLVSSVLIKPDEDNYKLSEEAKKELEQDLEDFEKSEEEAKNFFFELLKKSKFESVKNPENIWESFNQKLLWPLINEMGAKAYKFLLVSREVDKKLSNTNSERTEEFLESFQKKKRQPLLKVLANFFNSPKESVKRYVLSQLYACLAIRANAFDQETISALVDRGKAEAEFTIFLDTNFIFSLLELHSNNFNQPVKSFFNLVNQLPEGVEINFRVLPSTLEEANSSIRYHKEQLKDLRPRKKIVDAGKLVEIGGFAERLLEINESEGSFITAEEFLNPYIGNLRSALKNDYGIEVFNIDLKKRLQNREEEVKEDIEEWYRYSKYKSENEKPRGAIQHDVNLWHLVESLRPDVVETYLDANYFIATIDKTFKGYNEFKQKSGGKTTIPICVFPTSLIQLFNFWIPRSSKFEEAMVGAMATPFIFKSLDKEEEDVVIDILSTISRFEDLNDLSENTIIDCLVDEDLCQRVATKDKEEEKIEEIKNDLFKREKEKREPLKEKLDEKENKIETKEERIEILSNKVDGKKEEIDQIKERQEKLSQEKKEQKRESEKLEKQVKEVRDKNSQLEERQEFYKFILNWVGIPSLILLAVGLPLGLSVTIFKGLGAGLIVTAGALISVSLWLFVLYRKAAQKESLADTHFFRVLKGYRMCVLKFLGTLVIALLVEALGRLIFKTELSAEIFNLIKSLL